MLGHRLRSNHRLVLAGLLLRGCHDLSGRSSHDPEYCSNGTRSWLNLLWTSTSCKGRVGNVIELERIGKIPTEWQTSPSVLNMFKTIGEVVLAALNGVGTQFGRGMSVTTTTLSCGGRGCSQLDRFENVIHVSVSGLYVEQESPTAIARVSSSYHDLNTLPARLSVLMSRPQPSWPSPSRVCHVHAEMPTWL